VTAIEPNAAMRSYAAPREGVIWVDGTFEDTHLPAAARKWLVAAQAFHWADPERALPELARVLAPGRSLTVMWNDRDHAANPHMRFAREAIQREVPKFDEAYRDRDWAEVLTTGGHFGEVTYCEVAHLVPMPRSRFLELWRGHNRLNNIAGPDRFAKLIAAIEAHLAEADLDEVPVAYRCRSWTARRAG
jgi:SAM-dependent methyltransferase